MIRAVQHIPGFVTGAEPHVSEVATTAELLALPWVKQYATEDSNWCVAGEHLMVERNAAKRWWWVVARLSGDPVDLPEWRGPK